MNEDATTNQKTAEPNRTAEAIQLDFRVRLGELRPVLKYVQDCDISTGKAIEYISAWLDNRLELAFKEDERCAKKQLHKKDFNYRLKLMGWTQAEFAEFIDKKRTVISNWKTIPIYAVRVLEYIEETRRYGSEKTKARLDD